MLTTHSLRVSTRCLPLIHSVFQPDVNHSSSIHLSHMCSLTQPRRPTPARPPIPRRPDQGHTPASSQTSTPSHSVPAAAPVQPSDPVLTEDPAPASDPVYASLPLPSRWVFWTVSVSGVARILLGHAPLFSQIHCALFPREKGQMSVSVGWLGLRFGQRVCWRSHLIVSSVVFDDLFSALWGLHVFLKSLATDQLQLFFTLCFGYNLFCVCVWEREREMWFCDLILTRIELFLSKKKIEVCRVSDQCFSLSEVFFPILVESRVCVAFDQ